MLWIVLGNCQVLYGSERDSSKLQSSDQLVESGGCKTKTVQNEVYLGPRLHLVLFLLVVGTVGFLAMHLGFWVAITCNCLFYGSV